MSLLPPRLVALVSATGCLGLALTAAVPGSAASPAPAAAAAPTIMGQFPLTAQPEQLTPGPDGNMWVTLSGSGTGDELARVQPDGTINYYDLDTAPGPGGITTGPDGNLWATLSTGVVKIPPDNPTSETAFPIAGFSDARGITSSPDGNLWAASGDKVFKIPAANPAAVAQFTVSGMGAREITRGTDGRFWVADSTGGRIVSFANDGTSIVHAVGGGPQGIAAGPGGQVLYTNPGSSPQDAGRLTLGGTPQITPLPGTDPSFSATFAVDQAYWVGLFLTGELARINPTGALTKLGTFPAPFKPRYLAAGPGGTIWVSLQDPGNVGAIGRVSGLVAPSSDVKVSVTIKGTRVQLDRRGRGVLRLACPAGEASGPCAGRVSLKATTRPRRISSSKPFSVAAGQTRRISIKVTDSALRRLRAGNGRLPATVVARVSDAVGNKATVRKKVQLRLR